jgi:hypothetical protein
MSYRSNVAILIAPQAVEKLLLFFSKSEEARNILAPGMKRDQPEKGAMFFNLEYVEWVDVPAAEEIEDFLQELGEENYRFVRCGSDYDDIHESGYYFDGLLWGYNPNPKIQIDFE